MAIFKFLVSAFLGFFLFLPDPSARSDALLRPDPYAGIPQEILVYEVRSNFSHIKIRDRGSQRTLYFVRDSGEEAVETSIDLRNPHLLQVAYTRTMFAGLLLKPQQKNCLIVGLGGGAMVQFLNHFFPEIRVDAVEIDPVMVGIARDYFGTKPGPRARIFTEDAFDYLKRTTNRYDVIYMDAFLKPGDATDLTGVPRNLKTVAFLKSLHGKLREGGAVVFNLNENMETQADIRSIQSAFPSGYIFGVSGSGNTVVVGSLARNRVTGAELRKRGEALDRKRNHGFSFRGLVDQLSGRL